METERQRTEENTRERERERKKEREGEREREREREEKDEQERVILKEREREKKSERQGRSERASEEEERERLIGRMEKRVGRVSGDLAEIVHRWDASSRAGAAGVRELQTHVDFALGLVGEVRLEFIRICMYAC